MDRALLERICYQVASRGQTPREVASDAEIARAERDLGFGLPDLLRDCYRLVGNGGFGPGYGIIGVGVDGHHGDFGDLISTYRTFHQDRQMEHETWPVGLLPFLKFGCNVFDCVDCLDPRHPVRTMDQGQLKRSIGTLDSLVERWLGGIDAPFCMVGEEIIGSINPFTREKETRIIRRLL